MSHEIRTPMTAIVGFADLLSREDLDRKDQAQWRNQLNQNARYLQDLIGNVLDMSAVEVGEVSLNFEPVSLLETVSEAVDTLRARADTKNLSLETAVEGMVPDAIVMDRVRFKEIIVNLVSNAVKYTEQGGVTVTLSAERRGADALLSLTVSDTGMGIDPVQLENLFIPFNRVHDTHQMAGIVGTGLGLALSREIAHALNGDITVSSQRGTGSYFTLMLPTEVPPDTVWEAQPTVNPFLVRTPPIQSNINVDRAKDLSDLRLLVCEDSSSITALLEAVLQAAGAEVTLCANGLIGVQCFEEQLDQRRPPDLILMDMQMPIMDGYEAVSYIKQLRKDIPVVALTAFALADDIDRCLTAGCDYYLTKPIQIHTFTQELRSIWGRFGT